MKFERRLQILAAFAALATNMLAGYAASESATSALASPESFAAISDSETRSAAYFTELGKVLTHPRCVNCHPAGDRPRQGDAARLHQPPVERGADGNGTAAMRCSSCHQQANFEPGRVPGHPQWHLAPREMSWEGKTLAEICAQIKDPARLVGWAWAPGFGRSPAPGTQPQARALAEAWAKSGAACPAK